MGNCEICNKSVHEKSLIFSTSEKYKDDFLLICLQCDDNEKKEEK